MRTGQGLLVSVEGISGTGKSYLVEQLRGSLADLPVTFVPEVSERQSQGTDVAILAILRESGDQFFRGGKPLTETLLLMGLKVYDYEVIIAPELCANRIVVEDRSVDTIAVYQSILLGPSDRVARCKRLLGAMANLRPIPDVTFLVEDDLASAIHRAERRVGRAYRPDERELLAEAAALYREHAKQHAQRIICLDRRAHAVPEMLVTIRTAIQEGLGRIAE
jgi:thymidylate kinase